VNVKEETKAFNCEGCFYLDHFEEMKEDICSKCVKEHEEKSAKDNGDDNE